jgi:hypothetical protein
VLKSRRTDALSDVECLALGSLVIPGQRRPDALAVGIKEHGAVHLARQANRIDGNGRLGDRPLQDLMNRGPPILRPLLDPTRTRRQQRIRRFSTGEDRAVGPHNDRPGGGRAEIDADRRSTRPRDPERHHPPRRRPFRQGRQPDAVVDPSELR